MIRRITNWFYSPDRPSLSPGQIFLTYVVIAMITFGYDAARYPVYFDNENQYNSTEISPPLTTLKGIMAGAAWPLFWTWEVTSLVIDPVAPPVTSQPAKTGRKTT